MYRYKKLLSEPMQIESAETDPWIHQHWWETVIIWLLWNLSRIILEYYSAVKILKFYLRV